MRSPKSKSDVREMGYYWVCEIRPPAHEASSHSESYAPKILYWDGQSWINRECGQGYSCESPKMADEVLVLSARLEPPKIRWEFTTPRLVVE